MSEQTLAIHGGKPVRESYLPYGTQWLDSSDTQEVINVLKGDYLTTGPTIEQFEQKIADYVGAQYAVAFSSGTAALHGACFAVGIQKNDQVITTPLTFAATSNTILYQGGDVLFADIDSNTYNISPKAIEALITDKTKAIITVDFTGQPVEYERIQEIAAKYAIPFISDSAHALGASYHQQKVGPLADMTMFSFHPVKHITTGEGGIITTDDPVYAQKLRDFRSHGITRDLKRLAVSDQPWYYEMQSLGFNYRMTDLQAALGLSQIKKIEKFLAKRRAIADKYNEAFRELDLISLPYQLPDTNSSWHLYVIRLQLNKLKANRTEIFQALQKENIGVNVHYIPVYYHPYYQQLGYQKGLCPHAETLYQAIITLPLFPKMRETDVEDVITAVKKVLYYYEVPS
ncbi:UDP-4-amino-4,6-dideoxy-N-acetyl-beta-L-altrosamine transaminase [Gracilibacillus salitolerans]|uniref:UDP-4-amino-4, 6-dideoxy-N-acetyl-beta-L-altrosamine transaminase n=1 Tax=Gracilibacillus salitolerans TaxID=2663022 RepID=A0A5Q2TMK3_9BACI|nr:UDP-4-amino-4,6-dideoxy-N-acetyl-beta-L-altrosamine transaminase [Gracilibacillus salitolerans]QGH35223.1 UDP-4-amino-4,6-dideoxy-N-acetyl-beta-L-altrosamine transaminase [Gracilibacillus salitolerans]